MAQHGRKPHTAKRAAAMMLAFVMAMGGVAEPPAKTTHDELDYTVTVEAKRSTITVDPHNNHVINPDIPGAEGTTDLFTVTGRIGDSVDINAGSADAAYIESLEEGDASESNIAGFTYTFGTHDEDVTVHWKQFTTYFNGNTGTATPASKSTEYNNANTMADASKTGYNFDGWYTAQSGGTRVGGAGTSYTQGNTAPTYYAHWSCNHAKPTHGRTTTTGGWTAVDASTHRQLVSVKCATCQTALTAENYYNTGSHTDADKNGLCDTCNYRMYNVITVYIHVIPGTDKNRGKAYSSTSAASKAAVTQTGIIKVPLDGSARSWLTKPDGNQSWRFHTQNDADHTWWPQGYCKNKSGTADRDLTYIRDHASNGDHWYERYYNSAASPKTVWPN